MPRFSGFVAFDIPTWPDLTDRLVCPSLRFFTSSASMRHQISNERAAPDEILTVGCLVRRKQRIVLSWKRSPIGLFWRHCANCLMYLEYDAARALSVGG